MLRIPSRGRAAGHDSARRRGGRQLWADCRVLGDGRRRGAGVVARSGGTWTSASVGGSGLAGCDRPCRSGSTGTGPQLDRTIRLVGMERRDRAGRDSARRPGSPGFRRSPIASSSRSAARLPISTNGCWMVVSGGRIWAADSMSSKPITDTSSRHPQSRVRRRRHHRVRRHVGVGEDRGRSLVAGSANSSRDLARICSGYEVARLGQLRVRLDAGRRAARPGSRGSGPGSTGTAIQPCTQAMRVVAQLQQVVHRGQRALVVVGRHRRQGRPRCRGCSPGPPACPSSCSCTSGSSGCSWVTTSRPDDMLEVRIRSISGP